MTSTTTKSIVSSKISWQQPFVNTFKHFSIISDKNVLKQGNITSCMDGQIKSSIYKIVGPSPANNFISMPKHSGQSINLTGRYIYFLFKPAPNKCFSLHIDVLTVEKVCLRLSFSNLFKEFKSSPTWLQFPYVIQSPKDTVYEKTEMGAKDLSGSAPPITKWTVFGVDLVQLVQLYTNRTFSCVRSYRLCANMSVKNVITSDLIYEPGLSHAEAKLKGVTAFPRELSYPCEKCDNWLSMYDYILFPSDQFNSTGHSHILIECDLNSKSNSDSSIKKKPIVLKPCIRNKEFNLPLVNVPNEEDNQVDEEEETNDDIHVFPKSTVAKVVKDEKFEDEEESVPSSSSMSCLQPDPIMRLRRIVGYGCLGDSTTTSNDCIKWSQDSQYIVYNCQAVVVAYHLVSGIQWCFVGHSDKVSCLSLSPNNDYLVSGQSGPHSLIRLWNFKTRKCLAIFKRHDHSLYLLEYSACGNFICGVGKDKQAKTLLCLWDLKELSLAAKSNNNFTPRLVAIAHTDAHISRVLFVHYDSSRLVSCGRDNIKFWRLKEGTLRCCSVNLASYLHALNLATPATTTKNKAGNNHLEFTDLCINTMSTSSNDDKAYACTLGGQIFELSLAKMEIETVRMLMPLESSAAESILDPNQHQPQHQQESIHLKSLTVTVAHCVTGSTDGFLRIWSLDFGKVFAEAKYEAAISQVRLSPNALKVITATTSGSLGILDLKTKEYITLVRSHTQSILDVAYDASLKYLATVSNDSTVRLWNYKSFRQLYDFSRPNEKPTKCCFLNANHAMSFSKPDRSVIVLACGFSSGKIRVFDVNDACLLHEIQSPHHQHHHHQQRRSSAATTQKCDINNLMYAANGKRLISTDQLRSIALYDVENKYNLVRLLPNLLGSTCSCCLSFDQSQLAIIGSNDLVITLFDAYSLNETLRIDLSNMISMNCSPFNSNLAQLDHNELGARVCFAPVELDELICVTSSNRLVKFSATSGHLLLLTPGSTARLHKRSLDCVCVSQDGRYLVTSGDNGLIKVWDYEMRFERSFQTFIGHSAPIARILFSADQSQLISVGDTILVWDLLSECGNNLDDDGSEKIELPQGRDLEDMKDLPIRVIRELRELNNSKKKNQPQQQQMASNQLNACDYSTLRMLNEASFKVGSLHHKMLSTSTSTKTKTTKTKKKATAEGQLNVQYNNLASWSNISFEKPRTPPIANIYIDSIGNGHRELIEDTFSDDLNMMRIRT